MVEKIKAIAEALQSFLPTAITLICAIILFVSPGSNINGDQLTEKLLDIVQKAVLAVLAGWALYLAIRNAIDSRATIQAQMRQQWLIEMLDKRIQLKITQIKLNEAGLKNDHELSSLQEVEEEIDRLIDEESE